MNFRRLGSCPDCAGWQRLDYCDRYANNGTESYVLFRENWIWFWYRGPATPRA